MALPGRADADGGDVAAVTVRSVIVAGTGADGFDSLVGELAGSLVRPATQADGQWPEPRSTELGGVTSWHSDTGWVLVRRGPSGPTTNSTPLGSFFEPDQLAQVLGEPGPTQQTDTKGPALGAGSGNLAGAAGAGEVIRFWRNNGHVEMQKARPVRRTGQPDLKVGGWLASIRQGTQAPHWARAALDVMGMPSQPNPQGGATPPPLASALWREDEANRVGDSAGPETARQEVNGVLADNVHLGRNVVMLSQAVDWWRQNGLRGLPLPGWPAELDDWLEKVLRKEIDDLTS